MTRYEVGGYCGEKGSLGGENWEVERMATSTSRRDEVEGGLRNHKAAFGLSLLPAAFVLVREDEKNTQTKTSDRRR